jgi:hypothetical protein
MVRHAHAGMGPLLALSLGLQAAGGLSFGLATSCATGLRYYPATPFAVDAQNAALRGHRNLRALLTSFVRQKTDSSCSVATVTTVVGAVQLQRSRPQPSQTEILQSDVSGRWAQATYDAHSAGTTLEEMALYALQAFYSQGIRNVTVEVVHVTATTGDSRDTLLHNLQRSEQRGGNTYLMLNFRQDMLVHAGAPCGHMSVLGAYDAACAQVLVLDVDGDIPQPYWVSVELLLAGMNTADDAIGEGRGYLVVHLAD